MQASLISCMPPSMACGVTSRECARSFSSVSNNTGGVLVEEEFQLPCHGESFMGSPPEMGGDDGDLHHITTGPSDPPPPVAKKKRKRSLPGTPDPSAEVIALSPTTLMATNRFVCEICHKGFQRDQNLQLHRRGHNLPWKLRQRGAGGEGGATGAPPRKRVYVCPEPSCVHHSPGRALGDLTGIKKHFCRKHGEKKWKCDRCAKRYAVHSDWKAHSKVCGTREYKCDCGTVFSRRDSFVTHRAFCDALARENNKLAQPAMNMATVASALQGQQAAHHLMLPSHADDVAMETDADDNATGFVPDIKSPHLKTFSDDADVTAAAGNPLGCMLSSLGAPSPSAFNRSRLSLLGLAGPGDATAGSFSPSGPASMSATALLQKAAEMGATTTSGYGAGFSSTGLGSTMVGLDRFFTSLPFAPTRAHGLYDGLVGFGVDAPMAGQLYDGGAHGVGSTTTRAIRSMTHGGDQTTEVRRAGDVVRVVDYMGVEEQRAFEGVSPFVRHMDPWA